MHEALRPFWSCLVLSGRDWFTVGGFLLSDAHSLNTFGDFCADEFSRLGREEQAVDFSDQRVNSPSCSGDYFPPAATRSLDAFGYLSADEFSRRLCAAELAAKFNNQHAEISAARRTFTPENSVLAPRLVRIGRDVPSFRAHGCFSFLCQESKRFLTTAHPYLYKNPPKIGGSLLILFCL